jgi:hypothetical protein
MRFFLTPKKTVFALAIILFVTGFLYLSVDAKGAVVKESDEIFKRWLLSQEIREDVNFIDLKKKLDSESIEFFVKLLPSDILPQIEFMFPDTLLYSEMSAEDIALIAGNVERMYGFMESDVSGFISFLLANKFAGTATNSKEEKDIREVGGTSINRKYRKFMEALLFNTNDYLFKSNMNSIANRFFEYCFYPSTFKHFSIVHSVDANRPVVRMLYETMWYFLARTEWKSWHSNTLKNLKTEYDKGKEIVYIAGGDDIFQLISNGVYGIRNIDPIYPTQTKYYSEGWDFLAVGESEDGGINDRIIFNDQLNKDRNIVMRRISYEEHGILLTTKPINGKRIRVPKSTTVWSIEDKNGKRLGTYTLERRFVEQKDFKFDPQNEIVVSFNELYFIMTANDENWGIDPHLFDKNIKMHIKQLRSPIDWEILMNIRKIQESGFPNRFGSSVIND